MKRSRDVPNHERVYGILKAADAPMTAYELLDAGRKHSITAPPTVYRALNRLIDEGRVHRLETINAYIACVDVHHEFPSDAIFTICNDCGNVEELGENNALKRIFARADQHGFKVDHAVVELKGRCGMCSSPSPR